MRRIALIASIAALLASVAHSKNSDTTTISSSINNLSDGLTRKFYKTSKNLFLSPFSISNAFGIAYTASCGETKTELKTFLHLEDVNGDKNAIGSTYGDLLDTMKVNENAPYELDIANAMFIDNNFVVLNEYSNLLKNKLKSHIQTVPFSQNPSQARAVINGFVNRATKGLIPTIYSQNPSPATKMTLINAIYFKGKWLTKFDVARTEDEDFDVSQCKSSDTLAKTKVKMMKTRHRFRYVNSEALQAEIVELPYNSTGSSDTLQMIVVLPSDACNFDQWTHRFANTPKNIKTLRQSMSIHDVTLHLPRFKFETEYDLAQGLQNELKNSLSPSACFSGITGKAELSIGSALHKAVIEVDEEGSRAAAATSLSFIPLSAAYRPPPKITFIANRPFMFFITRGDLILFHGIYAKP